MTGKTRNTNYEILDKILDDAGIQRRQGGSEWIVDEEHPEGHLVTSKEQFDQLYKSADKIERYLRS